jgi:drug/metabolite transporter (DMT)-like permease
VFGSSLQRLPPLLFVGAALTVGGLAGLPGVRRWRVSPLTLWVGVGGIFGYHYLYFEAFRRAPAIEVNLINYLWPLLIVVMSPLLLPGYSLRPRHIGGALLGLCGVALIGSGGRLALDWANLPGYALALAAAVTWACYSLLTKRLPPFPTQAVGGFCLAGGILALSAFASSPHEFTLAQLTLGDGAAILLAGLGPMGAAFYLWDKALKTGDPRRIGSLSYLTPLLSTLNLAVFAGRTLTPLNLAAMGLIMTGALLGSRGAAPAPAPPSASSPTLP